MKRLPFILCLLIASTTSIAGRSIACIIDLSHSMGIVDPETEDSRFKRGIAAINELLEKTEHEDDEWALVIFDDKGTSEIRRAFTSDRSAISSGMEHLTTWGVTPLKEVIGYTADYLVSDGKGAQKYLILVSDCINTYGDLYSLPSLDEVSARGIIPIILGFRHPEYPDLWKTMDRWARDAGGAFLFMNQVDQARRLIENGNVSRTEPARTESRPAPVILASEQPASTKQVQMPIWWIFMLPFLGVIVFLTTAARRWLAKRRSILAIPHTAVPQLELTVIAKGNTTETTTFSSFPITVSGAGNADLLLPKPKIQRGARTFSLVLQEGIVYFRSRALMVINGVGHKIKELKVGDRITFGKYRVVYQGISYVEIEPQQVPSPRFLLITPILAACVLGGWLARNPITVTLPDRKPEPPIIATIQSNLPAHEVAENGSRTRVFKPERTGTLSDDQDPAHGLEIAFPTVMWEPDTEPSYFKADALFIHAHPDDESLDFGVLISRFAKAGKRVAVVLLTDGDAGLDQYPQRIVNETYPPHDLKGAQLAGVRAEEARAALSVLGAQHFVRLGLRNHPYNGGLDVISADSVLSAWGGEAGLIDRLSKIIVGYNPDVVVSPEGPASAFEHFEHEAAGQIVENTLQKLEKDGLFAPSGRLVSIDPLQKQLYDDTVGVPGASVKVEDGYNYRAIQAAALKQHITQRDASVIGVENLSNFSNEFYRVLSWDIELSLEAYLAVAQAAMTSLN